MKTLLINLRVTVEDKRRIVAAAKRAHLSVSAWMRTVLLSEATLSKHILRRDEDDIRTPAGRALDTLRRSDPWAGLGATRRTRT